MGLRKRAFTAEVSEVDYPSSDGKPMAETDVHRELMTELIQELKSFFQSDPQVYVSGNLLLYYEEGNLKKSVAPDVFVVRGAGNHQRRVYKLWEEGRAPEVIFEISSRKTWKDDLIKKWELYARLGVREYFIFDPEYDYLEKPLRAYRLNGDEFEKMEVVSGRVMSATLGLEIVDTGKTLRLFDPQTKRYLPTTIEETDLRQQAEAEIARLRHEVAKLRRKKKD